MKHDDLPNVEDYVRTKKEINPNLCRCPDCHKIISRKADRCPYCGKTFKKNNPVVTVLCIMGMIVGFYFLIKGASGCGYYGL